MHGSVDWAVNGKAAGNDPWALAQGNANFDLGLPGPTKRRAAEQRFSQIWRVACEALTNATTIMIVGYQFAHTDDYAKEKLLQAIAANEEKHLTIRVVLGSQTGSDMVRRVEGLLEWALKRRGWLRGANADSIGEEDARVVLDTVPMLSQDFFAVATRIYLNRWE